MPAASEEASCEHLRSLCMARAVSTSLWLPLTAKNVNMDLGDVGVVPPSNLAPKEVSASRSPLPDVRTRGPGACELLG